MLTDLLAGFSSKSACLKRSAYCRKMFFFCFFVVIFLLLLLFFFFNRDCYRFFIYVFEFPPLSQASSES